MEKGYFADQFTGDGAATKTITLPWAASFVMVASARNNVSTRADIKIAEMDVVASENTYSMSPGTNSTTMAFNTGASGIVLTNSSFIVPSGLNASGSVFDWFAIKKNGPIITGMYGGSQASGTTTTQSINIGKKPDAVLIIRQGANTANHEMSFLSCTMGTLASNTRSNVQNFIDTKATIVLTSTGFDVANITGGTQGECNVTGDAYYYMCFFDRGSDGRFTEMKYDALPAGGTPVVTINARPIWIIGAIKSYSAGAIATSNIVFKFPFPAMKANSPNQPSGGGAMRLGHVSTFASLTFLRLDPGGYSYQSLDGSNPNFCHLIIGY